MTTPTLTKEYFPTDWRDHIVDPTQYEKDDEGNVIIDETTGKPKLKVIQEGTRFTASRANNFEMGILMLYLWIEYFKTEMEKMRILLEIGGRVPVNSGTFFDPFDADGSTKALTMLKESAVVQNRVDAAATTLAIKDAPFKIGEYLTIYDDEQSESVTVSAVDGASMTVSALANPYKKGAKVVRTNSVINDTENKIGFGNWGNYSIDVKEVI